MSKRQKTILKLLSVTLFVTFVQSMGFASAKLELVQLTGSFQLSQAVRGECPEKLELKWDEAQQRLYTDVNDWYGDINKPWHKNTGGFDTRTYIKDLSIITETQGNLFGTFTKLSSSLTTSADYGSVRKMNSRGLDCIFMRVSQGPTE